MNTGWSDQRRDALHRRALELQPAIAAAALRIDRAGLEVLYGEFFLAAKRLRLSDSEAWKVFALASVDWTMKLIEAQAELDDVEVEAAAQELIITTRSRVMQRG